MPKNGKEPRTIRTRGFYDRIADVQNLAMKINGYRDSVRRYLRSLDLQIGLGSQVLDAGCGTGLVSLAFRDANFKFGGLTGLDLSLNSLAVARDEFAASRKAAKNVNFVQANVLAMPFADRTFDLVLMCGVLEYVPLDEGLAEAARVMKKGARLVLLPVKPSIVGSVLELLYNFKIHPIEAVRAGAKKRFRIVGSYDFPITEPISWSKTGFLLEKK
ncbi:MAG: ubiquinone/menaquinone biosynthesis methyltransferase ubiE [Acidobacteria bacterium OLB17]|nr:MAG: ubiquinone/menaquinone biosynthesis methyltransferase ubiE [Acidobacteria bacterium OLB17]MCZ2390857.1 methyltransferase domain-containing protein [Acidobacteriota bacterium]